MAVLNVQGVSFSYPDRPPVLHNVYLSLLAGERVGLVGSNGCGKTTLFLLLCGVLKPATGTITLLGRPVVSGGFRPEIGLVFQNPDDQLFCPSVYDDVAFGPINMGLPQGEVEARVNQALTTAGVLHLADRAPHHLSGGEKRMVAIASVLAMRPQVMLYDEPDANLDRHARQRLIRFLQTSDETILLSSHNPAFIQDVCSRVVMMDAGRIVVATV
jgi:cobalt/nickel transport system ATP-binding protein